MGKALPFQPHVEVGQVFVFGLFGELLVQHFGECAGHSDEEETREHEDEVQLVHLLTQILPEDLEEAKPDDQAVGDGVQHPVLFEVEEDRQASQEY